MSLLQDDSDDDDEVDQMWMQQKELDTDSSPDALDLFCINRVIKLLTVPKAKFLVHNVFTMAFVLVFSYTFCGLPWHAQVRHIYIYVCVCISISIYVLIYIYIYVYMYVYMYVYIWVCIYMTSGEKVSADIYLSISRSVYMSIYLSG